MGGDGFAVKTIIAQIGNVARTQLKSQAVHNSGPEHMKKPGEKESRVQKLRETEEAQKSKVDSERRNNGRQGEGRHAGEEDPDGTLFDLEDQKDADEDIGLRLDIKA